MDTRWLRSIIRRYGDAGVLCVGLYLLLFGPWRGRRRVWGGLVAALVLAALLSGHSARLNAPCVCTPEAVRIIDLGALQGADLMIPTAVSNNRAICGIAVGQNDETSAFLWEDRKLNALPPVHRGDAGAAGINAHGEVVGWSAVAGGEVHAAAWRDRKPRDLRPFGGPFGLATAVNDRGDVAGLAITADLKLRGFLIRKGRAIDLGTLRGCEYSGASGLSANGDVVGWSANDDRSFYAFLWRDGKMRRIPPLAGGTCNVANDVDSQGCAVGTSEVRGKQPDTFHGFLWDGRSCRDLGTLGGYCSGAQSLNDDGVISGWAQDRQGELRACLWRNGRIADLNRALPSGSDWCLLAATATNRRGDIVGVGEHGGQYRGYLLEGAASP